MFHSRSLHTTAVAAVCLATIASGAIVVHALDTRAQVGHPVAGQPTVQVTEEPATATPSPRAATATVATTPAPTPKSKNPPPAAEPTPAGQYPYPLDAGGTVAVGQLTLTPHMVSGSRAVVTVRAAAGGWAQGQLIFVYWGQRYVLTLPGPGASTTLSVAPDTLRAGTVTVSGFQFPGNAPLRPVDGVGTATLTVAR